MSEPLRLLAIEDDQADFLLLVRHLREQGLCARCTRVDSEQALDLALDTEPWDAVLADYQVPGMDFKTTLASIRCRRPGMPVILVSGAVGEDRAVELLRLGVSELVSKDRLIRLVPAIERCLRAAADQRARESAESALRASEERFQLAMEVSRSFAFEWDPGTDRVRRSASSGAILGLDGEAAEHDTGQGYFSRLVPEDRERFVALLRSLKPGADRYRIEYRAVRDDGTKLVLEETARAFFDAQGRLQRLVGAATDITERKRDEARLAEQAEQLREADRRKDEFLAMLAHELRNPLAPIVNAVHILKTPGLGDAQIVWCREVIARQTWHLTRLVDDLLDISRITRGRIELHKQPVQVSEIVQRALETSRPLIDARHHRLAVQLPGEPVRVQGDAVRLAQALSNLLNNAAKFTDQGGEIRIAVECGPTEVAIRVKDTGRGIDPAMAPRLFDLFFQAEHTIDRAEGGLGIGLSLAQRLVAMHGGTVQAQSAGRGQGSELTIRLPRLPRLPDAPLAEVHAASAANPAAAGVRVLVVDDNRDLADSLALLLESNGYTVVTAYDGEMAVGLALADPPPHAVLLDLGLPGLDGYAVARAIRSRARSDLPAIRLIAMTGYGQPEDRERSRAAGLDAHLVKPVDWEVLRGVLGGLRAGEGAR